MKTSPPGECESCTHWHAEEGLYGLGQCRRFPPSIPLAGPRGITPKGPRVTFGLTDRGDVCGEYAPRESAP